MIGIDLFAGAGGMSLGAQMAGIKVKLAVENDIHAAATYAYNHPEVPLHMDDIRNLNEINIRAQKEQTIIFGGPPCKGFSTSNQRTRNINNPNNHLYREYLRIVKMLMPDWVVFENVRGILETEEGVFVERIETTLKSYGYTLSQGILNAAKYGVPQSRNRLFIIGSLHGIRVQLPDPIVTNPITVREALDDLPELENGASKCSMPYSNDRPSGYAKVLRGDLRESPNHLVTKNADFVLRRYEHIPQGGNWENVPLHLMSNYSNRERCHTGIYHRLHLDQPSKVIGNFRKNMVIHPTQNRGLSIREAARLQSFPDNFKFLGSIGFQQEQVGNAVPPLLAKVIFQTVINA